MTLRADRANLAERLRTPWWLAPGFGLVAAGYDSSSAFADDGGRSLAFIAALVGSVALIGGYRRTTGVKLARLGWRARAVVAFAVVASLNVVERFVRACSGRPALVDRGTDGRWFRSRHLARRHVHLRRAGLHTR